METKKLKIRQKGAKMKKMFKKTITMPLFLRNIVVFILCFSIAFNIWLTFVVKEDSTIIKQYKIILLDIYRDDVLVNNIDKAIRDYSIDSKKNKTYRSFFQEMYDRSLEYRANE